MTDVQPIINWAYVLIVFLFGTAINIIIPFLLAKISKKFAGIFGLIFELTILIISVLMGSAS